MFLGLEMSFNVKKIAFWIGILFVIPFVVAVHQQRTLDHLRNPNPDVKKFNADMAKRATTFKIARSFSNFDIAVICPTCNNYCPDIDNTYCDTCEDDIACINYCENCPYCPAYDICNQCDPNACPYCDKCWESDEFYVDYDEITDATEKTRWQEISSPNFSELQHSTNSNFKLFTTPIIDNNTEPIITSTTNPPTLLSSTTTTHNSENIYSTTKSLETTETEASQINKIEKVSPSSIIVPAVTHEAATFTIDTTTYPNNDSETEVTETSQITITEKVSSWSIIVPTIAQETEKTSYHETATTPTGTIDTSTYPNNDNETEMTGTSQTTITEKVSPSSIIIPIVSYETEQTSHHETAPVTTDTTTYPNNGNETEMTGTSQITITENVSPSSIIIPIVAHETEQTSHHTTATTATVTTDTTTYPNNNSETEITEASQITITEKVSPSSIIIPIVVHETEQTSHHATATTATVTTDPTTYPNNKSETEITEASLITITEKVSPSSIIIPIVAYETEQTSHHATATTATVTTDPTTYPNNNSETEITEASLITITEKVSPSSIIIPTVAYETEQTSHHETAPVATDTTTYPNNDNETEMTVTSHITITEKFSPSSIIIPIVAHETEQTSHQTTATTAIVTTYPNNNSETEITETSLITITENVSPSSIIIPIVAHETEQTSHHATATTVTVTTDTTTYPNNNSETEITETSQINTAGNVSPSSIIIPIVAHGTEQTSYHEVAIVSTDTTTYTDNNRETEVAETSQITTPGNVSPSSIIVPTEQTSHHATGTTTTVKTDTTIYSNNNSETEVSETSQITTAGNVSSSSIIIPIVAYETEQTSYHETATVTTDATTYPDNNNESESVSSIIATFTNETTPSDNVSVWGLLSSTTKDSVSAATTETTTIEYAEGSAINTITTTYNSNEENKTEVNPSSSNTTSTSMVTIIPTTTERNEAATTSNTERNSNPETHSTTESVVINDTSESETTIPNDEMTPPTSKPTEVETPSHATEISPDHTTESTNMKLTVTNTITENYDYSTTDFTITTENTENENGTEISSTLNELTTEFTSETDDLTSITIFASETDTSQTDIPSAIPADLTTQPDTNMVSPLTSRSSGLERLSLGHFDFLRRIGLNALDMPIKPIHNARSSSKLQQRRGQTQPVVGLATDAELSALSEELLGLETNSIAQHVVLNFQGKTHSSSRSSAAQYPLLQIKDAALRHTTIEKLRALYNNYKMDSFQTEYHNQQQQNQENEFVEAIMATPIMKRVMTFLKDKGVVTANQVAQQQYFRTIWFEPYSRGGGRLGSSGFEHVFLAEVKNHEISGLHNWVYFYEQEKAGNLKYHGYIKKIELNDNRALVKYRFDLNNISKPVNGMFVGTSPELELALYTICFSVRQGNDCPITLNGHSLNIRTYPFRYRGKVLIGSAFPEL